MVVVGGGGGGGSWPGPLHCVLNPSPLPCSIAFCTANMILQFPAATYFAYLKIFHVNSRFLGTDLNITDRKEVEMPAIAACMFKLTS